jgi:uncharacterized protein YodC (DUF2158 family)
MAETFQVGDVVQLKSGGPKMTVLSIGADKDPYCAWFVGDKRETGYFPTAVLVLVPHQLEKK